MTIKPKKKQFEQNRYTQLHTMINDQMIEVAEFIAWSTEMKEVPVFVVFHSSQ